MVDQNDPVDGQEYVLRRILNARDWYNDKLREPVQRVAFRPTKRDIEGLSIFRAQFVTPAAVAAAGPNPSGYYVARLRVGDLTDLGLSVIPDPRDDQLPGHAIIPELSYGNMLADKEQSKILQHRLAQLACDAIVLKPWAS